MFKINRSVFYFSQPFIAQATQKTIALFDNNLLDLPSVLNFKNKIAKKSVFTTLFSSKVHSSLFQLYLNFLQNGEQAPSGIAYDFIEQNLRKKTLSELKNKKKALKLIKYRMLCSRLLQRKQIYGVFIHRKYNLPQQSYEINLKRPEIITCELKKIMHSASLTMYEKNIRAYEKDKMKEIYGSQFTDFMNQKLIVRYFYQVESQLQIQIKSSEGVIKIGHESPTKHLLQVQSYFDTISGIEQFYLTDVDNVLSGNSFFR